MFNQELIDAKRYIELALFKLESKRVISRETQLAIDKLIESSYKNKSDIKEKVAEIVETYTIDKGEDKNGYSQ